MSALGGVIQLKSIAIEERPVWRLHWSAFSSQRECVWQLTRFGGRKWRSGLNRIGHPDWVKLSVELNCAPNQNTKFFPFRQSYLISCKKLPFKVIWQNQTMTFCFITKGQMRLPFIQKWQLRLLSSVASCYIKKKKINEGENIDKFQNESFNGSLRRSFPLYCE